jgi:hypothetical protein
VGLMIFVGLAATAVHIPEAKRRSLSVFVFVLGTSWYMYVILPGSSNDLILSYCHH